MSAYQRHFQKLRSSQGQEVNRSDSPEDIVREHLKERITQRRKSVRRVRSDRPVLTIALLLSLALGMGTMVYIDSSAVEEAFSELKSSVKLPQIKAGLFGVGQAAESKSQEPQSKSSSSAENAGMKSKNSAKDAAEETSTVDKGGVQGTTQSSDVNQSGPEELRFFKNLNARKEQLDRREAEVVKLEEELQKSRLEIEERIKELEALRSQISQTLADRVKRDQEKVAKLVDVYSNMKPAQAAKVVESLNEDLAMDVLEQMKKKNAADILNAMSSEKAKRLSEMMTGYERSQSRAPAAAQKGEVSSP